MNCSKCGAPLNEGAKFCTACGTPVEIQSAAQEQQPIEPVPAAQPAAQQPQAEPQPQAPTPQQPQGQYQQPGNQQQSYQQPGNQQQGYQQPSYQQQSYQQPNYQQQQPEIVYTTDGNKRALAMSMYWASIIGIIMCVSVCDRRDEFIRFHLNQAFVLFIFAVICLVLCFLIIPGLFAIFVFVCVILGTISAHKGTCKEVPLLGKIRWIK